VNLLLLAGGGVLAGAVNAVVGSGTLLTYPLLLGAGLPPVAANASNSMGLVPGSAFATWIYRDELSGRGPQLKLMAGTAVVGALAGTGLVLALPAQVFESVVPWLILSACILVIVQPRLLAALNSRGIDATRLPRATLIPVLFLVGVYAGYFGAAQGIILMAVLATLYDIDLQRSNAAKIVLQGVSNAAAALLFAIAGVIDWPAALAVGIGASVGGLIGAPFARRLPPSLLRAAIVAVGLVAAIVSFSRM